MKKTLYSLITIFFLSILSSCGYQVNATVNETSADVDYIYYTSAKEEKSILKDINKKSKTKFNTYQEFAESLGLTSTDSMTINKTIHNGYTISTTYNSDEFDNLFIVFNKKYASLSANELLTKEVANNYKSYVNIKNTKLNYCVYNIKYPYKVYKANGKINKDGYTVTYNLSNLKKADKRFWAIFNSKQKSTVSLNGLNKNTIYYNKKLTISLNNVASAFSINNIEQYCDSYTFTTDGSYTIKVTNINGKTVTYKAIIDKTKPIITGIKNGATYTKSVKIKFSDKTSGISSAKLNNKSIKSGSKINKPGKYTLVVQDKAGNKSTVKFTLK